MATEIKSSKNTFSEESTHQFEQLTVKSDMLLPDQKAIIKVLSGTGDVNSVQVKEGDLVEVSNVASVAIRTRFQETLDLHIQYIAV